MKKSRFRHNIETIAHNNEFPGRSEANICGALVNRNYDFLLMTKDFCNNVRGADNYDEFSSTPLRLVN